MEQRLTGCHPSSRTSLSSQSFPSFLFCLLDVSDLGMLHQSQKREDTVEAEGDGWRMGMLPGVGISSQ